MADTAAAIRAAREVHADELSPDLYRRANEFFFKAKREYKFKNFKEAKLLAEQARKLAEQAEFDAAKSGATRSESDSADAYNDMPGEPTSNGNQAADPSVRPPGAPKPETKEPYVYPTPEPTPADSYEQRKKDEKSTQTSPNNTQPTPNK